MLESFRTVSISECGSFLYNGDRIPYVTGCKLPSLPISLLEHTFFAIIPNVVQIYDEVGLSLQIIIQNSTMNTCIPMFFSYIEHADFLQELMEASTIYLLEGEPIKINIHNQSTFMNRLARSGQGIEIPYSVKESIEYIKRLNAITTNKIYMGNTLVTY